MKSSLIAFKLRFSVYRAAGLLAALIVCSASLLAQNSGSLHGRIADPSGAVIPNATVTVKSAAGQSATATSGADGAYSIRGLAPGEYSVTVDSKGFAPFSKSDIAVAAGRAQNFDVTLEIQTVQEKVNVEAEGTTLDTSPANNASSVVLKGKDLEALSDDPDELQSELEALAGPSAGPNGGQIYIDGFTGGQLPPKSAIREIRINQNPFSAEYDKLGYGRIEILTKPGSDKFHGQFMFNENNSIFNSKNPFINQEPDYHSELYDGNFGGPLGKNASFFLDAQRRNINDVEVVSPQCGGIALAECALVSVPNPSTRTHVSPRVDFALGKNNTVTARYSYFNHGAQNNGIGQQGPNQISLPSLGYNSGDVEHTLQVSDTQVFGPRVVNETRFQYHHEIDTQDPLSAAPELSIAGFFATGGNSAGHVVDTENGYEIQNYTSLQSGNHFLRMGGRVRIHDLSERSAQNFNGTFSYPSLTAFVNNQPNQFSITTGQPLISNTFADAGIYAEDDWKARSNLTLSYGLRFETQTDIGDHGDFAPRIGLAWGIGRKGSSPKTVLRAGYGIFYDRFPQNLVLQASRLNGTTQQEFVIESPTFGPNNIPTSFSQFAGALAPSTVYRIDPKLRAPYTMQVAVGVERQLVKNATLSVTYLNSRGLHQIFTDNINAPFPGTFPANPICPLGCGVGNIYEYQSQGIFKQNQLIANISMRYGPRLSIFGFYTLNYANSDTSGSGSFPTNPYDPSVDYGRSGFDVRNRLFVGGSLEGPFGLRFSPFVFAQSGQPYNITVPENLFGTSIFNARPGFAVGAPGCATFSTSDPFCFSIPALGQAYTPIPINYGTGPDLISVNLRVSKTFGLGPRLERAGGGNHGGDHGHGRGFGGFGGGGMHGMFGDSSTDHRYNLTFSLSGRNIFNRQNLSVPVGTLTPQAFSCAPGTRCTDFGESIALANGPFNSQDASRRVDMQVRFSF